MTRKLFAALLLSLAVSACEQNPNETIKPNPSPATQASPTPAPVSSPESSAAAATQWKAGDKVKATINGSVVEATIVSVDEKVGKATIKVQGEAKERMVNFTDIVKQ